MSKTQTTEQYPTTAKQYRAAQKEFFESNILVVYDEDGNPTFVCAHCGKQYHVKAICRFEQARRTIRSVNRHLDKKHGVDCRYGADYHFIWETYPHESVRAKEERRLYKIYQNAHFVFLREMPKEMRKLWQ